VPSSLKLNADAGALMVEMEIAALFIIGSMRGIRTAAIATATEMFSTKVIMIPTATSLPMARKRCSK